MTDSRLLTQLKQHFILGMKVNETSYQTSTHLIVNWAETKQSRSVCLANVHMVMEAFDSPEFRQLINTADLVNPDGMPLAWVLKKQQVCGRDLTQHVCHAAASKGITVGFYGSTPKVLEHLLKNIKQSYPHLHIGYAYSPPFRQLEASEKETIIQQIKHSGVQILFVGLGCPKQEHWMAEFRNHIPVVMLGIGAAFDVLAGMKPKVPYWIQQAGLEWFFRLCFEPRRLWYRNFWHSPRFIFFFSFKQLSSRIHKFRRKLYHQSFGRLFSSLKSS